VTRFFLLCRTGALIEAKQLAGFNFPPLLLLNAVALSFGPMVVLAGGFKNSLSARPFYEMLGFPCGKNLFLTVLSFAPRSDFLLAILTSMRV